MNQSQTRKPFALLGLMAVGAMLLSGCTGGDDAAKIDPSTQNTGNVVAALDVTGEIKLGEDEGKINKIADVGERVTYTFTVTSKSKAVIKEVGVSTTQGDMWCKDEAGKTGKLLDLEPGKKLVCTNADLPEEATKDEGVAKPHVITAEDVTAKVFEVIAKGHGKDPAAKNDNAKIVVAEPIALKISTVPAG